MRSLSLTRSSRGAADADFAAVAGQRGDRRQFVNEPGHFVRRDVDPADPIAFDDDRAARFAGVARRQRRLSTRAPNRRRTPMRSVRVGFRPTSSISTREPGQRRRRDHPERRRREVARHGERLRRPACLAAGDRRRACRRRRPGRRRQTPAARARCGRASAPARSRSSCRSRAGRPGAPRSSPARSGPRARCVMACSVAAVNRQRRVAVRPPRCGRPSARAAR